NRMSLIFRRGLLRSAVGLDLCRDEADELARERDDLARVVAARAELSIDTLRENLDRLLTLTASLRLQRLAIQKLRHGLEPSLCSPPIVRTVSRRKVAWYVPKT